MKKVKEMMQAYKGMNTKIEKKNFSENYRIFWNFHNVQNAPSFLFNGP